MKPLEASPGASWVLLIAAFLRGTERGVLRRLSVSAQEGGLAAGRGLPQAACVRGRPWAIISRSWRLQSIACACAW